MPNIYISARIAEYVDEKAQYVKNKGFDEDSYQKWIVSYLETFKTAKKQDIINLLSDKLPDSLDDRQKEAKVKKAGKIKLDSDNKRLANWILEK